jgi:CHAD domain-containing protein
MSDPDGMGTTLGAAVRSALIADVTRLKVTEAAARAGDPEGVHQMRVASRRLRSHLRTFGPALDGEAAEPLNDELKWLAAKLGAVRDGDVMRELIDRVAGPDGLEPGPLRDALERDHEQARRGLIEALASARFEDLKSILTDAVETHRLMDPEADGLDAEAALPGLVARPWRKLLREGRKIEPDASLDDELHALRVRAKRARYAAEAWAVATIDPARAEFARALARDATRLQTVLGDHQDAVVAAEAVTDADPASIRLARSLRTRARKARRRFRKAWDRLDSRTLRTWIRCVGRERG